MSEQSILCPECKQPLEKHSKKEGAGGIERYKCPNAHMVSVSATTHKVLSVIIPFEELKACPKCGSSLKVDFDKAYTDEKTGDLIRFARYKCTKGQVTDKRQTIRKVFRDQPLLSGGV